MSELKPIKQWENVNGVIVSFAFTSGGEHYYYVKDVFNTFAQRAMEALSIYDKWEMRCTRKYLIDWLSAMDEVTTKTINFHEFYKLLAEIKERINFAIPTEDIIWEFAGVAFFDEQESPFHYDHDYAKEKIKRWKESDDIDGFFFKTPIKDLIPFPDLSQSDLKDYLKVINQVDQKQIEHLYTLISSNQQSQDLPTA